MAIRRLVAAGAQPITWVGHKDRPGGASVVDQQLNHFSDVLPARPITLKFSCQVFDFRPDWPAARGRRRVVQRVESYGARDEPPGGR